VPSLCRLGLQQGILEDIIQFTADFQWKIVKRNKEEMPVCQGDKLKSMSLILNMMTNI
jgi:hypothetical protein